MASNSEVWGHLGSKLAGLGPIFALSGNVWVQLGSKLEVLKPSWLTIGRRPLKRPPPKARTNSSP
eukprot:10421248-Karenia_brevis.AAC.1